MPTVKIFSMIWLAALFALPGSIYGQDAKLIEGAKKEGGKVVVYGSIENDTMDLIAAALKKKTGLETEFWRSSSTKVMDRVLNEMRTGKPLYDVVLTNTAPMEFMFNEGGAGEIRFAVGKIISKRSDPPKSRPAISQQRHRHRLPRRHHQTGGGAKVAGRSAQAAVCGKAGNPRCQPAYDHGAMDGEPAQSNGRQRKGRQISPRSGGDKALIGGIFDSGGRTDYHRRKTHRHRLS